MTSPRHFPKVRSRIHRTFFQWLHDNQSRFLTAPPCLGKRTDRCLGFTIPGLNSVLSFSLTKYELGVHVEWQGEWWDALIFFESCPEAVANGYVCHLCESDSQKTSLSKIYPSREALWIAHEFEPFLEWVNTKLVPAHWLALYGEANSGTWVKLVSEPNSEAMITVPVWNKS